MILEFIKIAVSENAIILYNNISQFVFRKHVNNELLLHWCTVNKMFFLNRLVLIKYLSIIINRLKTVYLQHICLESFETTNSQHIKNTCDIEKSKFDVLNYNGIQISQMLIGHIM